MKYYTKISVWENRKRVEDLTEFREKVITYFSNLTYPEFSSRAAENNNAKQARLEINLCFDKIHSQIRQTSLSTIINYRPPYDIGISGPRDLLANMFALKDDKFDPQIILDLIEKAIGIYKNDERNALWRSFNPLFWLGFILDYIVSLPLKLIGKIIGFDQYKLESSIFGKIVKGIGYVLGLLVAFLTVLQLTGYLDTFNSFIRTKIK